MLKKLTAEAVGTFWLVFGGCGSAVLAAAFPDLGIGFAGVALAFGLTVLTMAYAVGPISGGHFNPAVSLGLAIGGRFSWSELDPLLDRPGGRRLRRRGHPLPDRLRQGRLDRRAASPRTATARTRRAATACSPRSSIEIVLTAGFLIVILGATAPKAPRRASRGIAIGLALTLIHLVSIPVTNTSVNPARSTAVALLRRDRRRRPALALLAGAAGRGGDRRRALEGDVRPGDRPAARRQHQGQEGLSPPPTPRAAFASRRHSRPNTTSTSAVSVTVPSATGAASAMSALARNGCGVSMPVFSLMVITGPNVTPAASA